LLHEKPVFVDQHKELSNLQKPQNQGKITAGGGPGTACVPCQEGLNPSRIRKILIINDDRVGRKRGPVEEEGSIRTNRTGRDKNLQRRTVRRRSFEKSPSFRRKTKGGAVESLIAWPRKTGSWGDATKAWGENLKAGGERLRPG